MFRNLAEDASIEIYFETFASTGAPVAPSSAFTTSDFAIYKNGSATAKSTTNGMTVTSPFNSETGCHVLIVDTSNDTGDAGFWTTGARYQVKFNTAKTVDSVSIDGRSVPRGSFGIQSEYMRGTDSAALASGVTVTAIGANVITAASIAAGAIDTATFAAETTLPRVTLVDTSTDLTNLPTIPTNWLTAAGLAADAASEIGAAVLSALGTGTWATEIPWNAAWDPEVQSECTDALNAYDPPTKAELDTAVTGLATSTNVTDAVTSIKGADADTLKTLSDQIDGIDIEGGDATLEKQNEILAAIQGTEVIQVASPNVQGNLVLTQGDDYDGIANPKAQWTVTTDYTDGWSVELTIRDADDAIVYTNSGEVVSSTVIRVTIESPTGLTMTGCPGQWQGKFDVQLTKDGSKKTIALGACYINEDQTR